MKLSKRMRVLTPIAALVLTVLAGSTKGPLVGTGGLGPVVGTGGEVGRWGGGLFEAPVLIAVTRNTTYTDSLKINGGRFDEVYGIGTTEMFTSGYRMDDATWSGHTAGRLSVRADGASWYLDNEGRATLLYSDMDLITNFDFGKVTEAAYRFSYPSWNSDKAIGATDTLAMFPITKTEIMAWSDNGEYNSSNLYVDEAGTIAWPLLNGLTTGGGYGDGWDFIADPSHYNPSFISNVTFSPSVYYQFDITDYMNWLAVNTGYDFSTAIKMKLAVTGPSGWEWMGANDATPTLASAMIFKLQRRKSTLTKAFAWPNKPLYSTVSYEGASGRDAYAGGADQFYEDAAGNDLIISQPWPYLDPIESGWGYGYADEIRAYNPDAVVLAYYNIMALRWDSEDNAQAPTLAALFESLYNTNGGVGSNLIAKDVNGVELQNGTFSAWITRKIPATADSLALAVYRSLKDSPENQAWRGLMLDFIDWPNPPNWQCNDGNCNDLVDFDEDGIAYNSDADDQQLYQDFVNRFLERMNYYFTLLRPKQDFVIMSNGYGPINASVAPSVDVIYYEWLDQLATSEAGWLNYFNGPWDNGLGSARVNRGLTMYETKADSSQYWGEALALVGRGIQWQWSDGPSSNGRNIGPQVRRLDVDTGASLGDATLVANSFPKFSSVYATASRTYENVIASAVVYIQQGSSRVFAMPQPYLIVMNDAQQDTLSRGGGWPRKDFP
jgi:hypothetical protein